MFTRFALACSLAFALTFGLIATPAFADDGAWPDKAIRIIVPFPAGAASDTLARLVSTKLSDKLGQPVVVYNRGGASGAIGTSQIATSDPDGYTFGIATTSTLVTAPILDPHVRYRASNFEPVALIGYSPYVLVVHPGVKAKSIHDFIALAKAKPNHVTYSSEGEASLAYLAGELFSTMAGVKLNQVPYKSSTQAVIDLLAGRIDSQFGILTTTRQYIKDGKLRALGVTTPQRVADFPDLPTIAESGLPGYDASLWIGVVAPAKTPAPIVAKVSAAITDMFKEPDMRAALANQAIVADPQPADVMHKRIDADSKKWSELAAKAGLVH